MPYKIIVVGLSAASISFLTKLRSFDQTSTILCISAEPDLPYNRCLLADFLVGDKSSDQIALKSLDFFTKNNIDVRLGSHVTKIDTRMRYVHVGDTCYEYDYLFLGIGTHPCKPVSLFGNQIQGVFTFHTLWDMQQIDQYIHSRKPSSAIVVGAGLNGIEAAWSLVRKGIAVTLVESQEAILPGQVDADLAKWVSDLAVRHGVTIVTGHKVEQVTACCDRYLKSARLENDVVIDADMMIVAAGSIPNTQLLDGADIKVDQGGIVVNEYMQTSVAGVLAGGDICVVPDLVTRRTVRSVTWSDAMLQGLCAATTLGQVPRVYQGALGLRDSYFFEKDFYACGDTTSGNYTKIVRVWSEHSVDIVYAHEGRIRGFVLIGDVSCVPELKKLYVTQEIFI